MAPIPTPKKAASMKKNEPVSKIMTKQLTTVHDHEPLSKVRKVFDVADIHHIPVVSGDRLVGILSSNDILRISFGDFGNQDGKGLDSLLDHNFSLADVMTKNPVTIASNATVRDAARVLGSNNFHALPVIEDEKLVGIVTSRDLINYLAEL